MTVAPRLARLDGRPAGRLDPLRRAFTTLGTHPSCDLSLDAADYPTLAARHAAVIRAPTGWAIRDLDSESGTWVNGHRVRREQPLAPGDEIRLGESGPRFRFEIGAGHPVPGGRRRMVLVLVAAAAVLAVWGAAVTVGSSRRTSAAREVLLARVDSLTRVLATVERRESTFIARLDVAVAEAEAARAAVAAETGSARLDSLTQLVDRLVAEQATLIQAARFDLAAVADTNRGAVAMLLVEHADRSVIAGTAVAVHRSGDTTWAITSRHLVVDETGVVAQRLGLVFDRSAQVFEAILLRSHPGHDLALLRVVIRGGTPVVRGIAVAPAIGTPVAVITYPLGLDLASSGDWRRSGVEASTFTATVAQITPDRLMLDGYGSPGMSGSPLLNAEGYVVGIVYGGATDSNGRLVLAVPGRAVQEFVGAIR